MKKIALCVLSLAAFASCGTPLNLGRSNVNNTSGNANAIPVPTIVPGMVLYFDAQFVNGSYGVPSSPCGATTWKDLSGHNNDGTIAGFQCTSSSGFAGSGTTADPYRLEFDGTGGAISTSLDVQPSAMPNTTWEGWVKPNRVPWTTRQTIFSSDDGGYDRQLLVEYNTSDLAAFTGTGVYTATAVDVNQWQHVAVTYTPTNIYVYKNGQKFTYPGGAPSNGNTVHFLTLGANPGYPLEGFSGSIAYLTVYDRALSDAEISQRCFDLVARFPGVTCQ